MSDLNFIHQYSPSAARSSRVLLLLHGTGGDENDLLPIGRELDPGAALLSPRGQVSENGAPRFFRRFAEGVFDQADVVQRAHELADFIAAAAAHYGFEPSHLTAVGYSNGANIAAVAMLLRPEVFPAAILFRAMVVLSNPPAADLHDHRVLISAGRHDPIIPLENAQRLSAQFQKAGALLTFEIQEAAHGLTSADLQVARRWLAEQ
ncbi:MAG: alpha/beta hydrolase [Chthoniobacterales bacterium]